MRRALTALALSVSLAGCGLGAGAGTSNVSLTVTRNFGSDQIASVNEKRTAGSETVMRMLERSFQVQTRYGGGFVEAINGVAGDSSRHDWFYYVNGVEAAQGAASTPFTRATASGGTCTTGPPRTACRRSSGRSPSRSCTGREAGATRRRSSAAPA